MIDIGGQVSSGVPWSAEATNALHHPARGRADQQS
jgi:hypothetical protein